MQTLISLIPLAVVCAIMLIPSWKLLRRIGVLPALLFIYLVPLFRLFIFLWVVAFAKWGIDDTTDIADRKSAPLQAS